MWGLKVLTSWISTDKSFFEAPQAEPEKPPLYTGEDDMPETDKFHLSGLSELTVEDQAEPV